MIKATYGWDNDKQIDPKMAANIAGCEAAGLPYGFYHYSYAESPEDAAKEVAFFLRHIAQYKPAMPISTKLIKISLAKAGGSKPPAFCITYQILLIVIKTHLIRTRMVPLTGIEPVRYFYRGILSPLRLPVPPQRPIKSLTYFTIGCGRCQLRG